MTEIHSIKLEILRPGPAHNQLLSPLTPYLALCGAAGAVTLQIPFEQRQLQARLERLRYFSGENLIAPSQRTAELRELGDTLGQILAAIPALLVEFGQICQERRAMIHLRLVLSAFELGLLPFEAAIAPEAYPGSGSPLLLQSNTPITLTREIRRSQPLIVDWNRPPRILFAFAAPAGFAPIPAEQHLMALRRAIDPWVVSKGDDADQLDEVKKILTVLPEATLDLIRQSCANTEYTHVHILGHGAPYDHAGDRRYGLVLGNSSKPDQVDVVDGERLAIALTTDRATYSSRSRPTVLSLATCDSANTNSIISPGGSIAHELHAAGIPWVFASQFPLWMKSSIIFTEILYKRLLQGADPRYVLHELRRRLRTACPETHDWASIVAYASIPGNFDKQIRDFRGKQLQRQIESKFARIDDIFKKASITLDTVAEIHDLSDKIRQNSQEWLNDSAALLSASERSRRLGTIAASEKRLGTAYDCLPVKTEEDKKIVMVCYRQSCTLYHQAVEADSNNAWVICQWLSMVAITRSERETDADLEKKYGYWWHFAQDMSSRQLSRAEGENRAAIYSTLAELLLLGIIYGGKGYSRKKAKEEIVAYCQKMVAICDEKCFQRQATVRQFRRYAEIWKQFEWQDLADAALNVLGTNGTSPTASFREKNT